MDARRRALLAAAAALPLAASCRQTPTPYEGGWVGAQQERGHRLRDAKGGGLPLPAVQRRAAVVVVGGGVAGLACARALAAAGIDDVQVLELEDTAGGNSRGHRIGAQACPLGAHYLPVPDESDAGLVGLLEALGLSRIENGRRVYDERHLCHSPQERVFVDGRWQDGLLPVQGQPAAVLDEYRRFSRAVDDAARLGFRLPTARAPWTDAHRALDALTWTAWLDEHGFRQPALRAHLDYCSRDDFGAGASQVSAWAGLQYFASRHGFHAPGDEAESRDAVLTWPEGNAWITERMAAPLRDRLHAGRVAMRVVEGRHEVAVDAWDAGAQRMERWTATQVVLAVPVFIAARLLDPLPSALSQAAAQMRYAPWLVANLQLAHPLTDRGGAPPAWDNVIHGSASLGYVDAMHQRLDPVLGSTLLTAYWALGGRSPDELKANRARLLSAGWREWAEIVIDDLAVPHPDLRDKLQRVDLMRYGHAMSIPVPGVRGSAALQALAATKGRVHFAHADLSAYSVFEEAFHHGERAARQIAGHPRGGLV
jgi:monoamine oxidase